ncbi:MAG: hypothetical protein QM487_00985 [Candidatus Marithrix sp.]
MLAYRQHITIKNPKHLVLNDLPLKAGQRVEVLILVKEDTDNPAEVYDDEKWNKLSLDERNELARRLG